MSVRLASIRKTFSSGGKRVFYWMETVMYCEVTQQRTAYPTIV